MLPRGDEEMEKDMILSIRVASRIGNLVSHFYLDVFQHEAKY